MNILLIPDSFKDSLSASEVAMAMENGIRQLVPQANIYRMTASDGGEGFLDSVKNYLPDTEQITTEVVDPLGRKINSDFLFHPASKSAYVELAKASGLELLSDKDRNPMKTSTYGTGLQIAEALKQKPEKIFIGLGGSATNDGGAGLASAMGYRFLNAHGKSIETKGESLSSATKIISPDISQDRSTSFYAINDVQNPLLGPKGAAFTYARQKGASNDDIMALEDGLQHMADLCMKTFGTDFRSVPGTGAAGGTGFGLKTFLNAQFISGVSFMLDLAGFETVLRKEEIQLIITGEGMIDHQTAYGKMVSGVAAKASTFGVPVAAICGKLELEEIDWRKLGLSSVKQLYEVDQPAGYSFENAEYLIAERAKSIVESVNL